MAILVLWITCAAVAAAFVRHNGWTQIVYTLDDPYIHMTLAKNLASHGVWGVNPHEFSSSSSSLLWTLLLSLLFRLTGPWEAASLAINMLAASALLVVVFVVARRHVRGNGAMLMLLLLVIFLSPVVPVVFAGMEHLLQAVITLLFLFSAAKILETAKGKGLGIGAGCLLLAVLVTAIRYEGIFTIMAVAFVLAWRKRLLAAATVSLAGAIPVVAYGLFSVAQGSYFLPNTVLAKGYRLAGLSWAGLVAYPFHSLTELARNPHLLVLVGTCCALGVIRIRKGQLQPMRQMLLVSFVLVTLLHLHFAATGWWYRYELYLVVTGLVVSAVMAKEELEQAGTWFKGIRLTPKTLVTRLLAWRNAPASAGAASAASKLLIGLLAVFASWPLVLRGIESLSRTPLAMTNVYQQQYQMGTFLQQFYPSQAVAANDIGAICYKGDCRIVDLIGLASIDVIRAKKTQTFNTDFIRNITARNNAHLAMVYDQWFQTTSRLPAEWVCAARWTIPNNIVCGNDTVAFYATSAAEAETLVRNLAAFAPQLPPGVKQVLSPTGLPEETDSKPPAN